MQTPDYILLIDDDESTNFINRKMLGKSFSPKEIYLAENGEDAFAVIHALEEKAGPSEKVLSILLDLNMPLLNGFEFLNELKTVKLDLKIRIYILSGFAGKKEQEQIQQFPIAGFVEKPLQPDNVEKIISGQEGLYFNQVWEKDPKA